MSMYNFVPLVGKIVSIAIDNETTCKDSKKESYLGRVKQVFDDYIVLDFNSDLRPDIEQIVINKKHIVSLWIYKTEDIKLIKNCVY